MPGEHRRIARVQLVGGPFDGEVVDHDLDRHEHLRAVSDGPIVARWHPPRSTSVRTGDTVKTRIGPEPLPDEAPAYRVVRYVLRRYVEADRRPGWRLVWSELDATKL